MASSDVWDAIPFPIVVVLQPQTGVPRWLWQCPRQEYVNVKEALVRSGEIDERWMCAGCGRALTGPEQFAQHSTCTPPKQRGRKMNIQQLPAWWPQGPATIEVHWEDGAVDRADCAHWPDFVALYTVRRGIAADPALKPAKEVVVCSTCQRRLKTRGTAQKHKCWAGAPKPPDTPAVGSVAAAPTPGAQPSVPVPGSAGDLSQAGLAGLPPAPEAFTTPAPASRKRPRSSAGRETAGGSSAKRGTARGAAALQLALGGPFIVALPRKTNRETVFEDSTARALVNSRLRTVEDFQNDLDGQSTTKYRARCCLLCCVCGTWLASATALRYHVNRSAHKERARAARESLGLPAPAPAPAPPAPTPVAGAAASTASAPAPAPAAMSAAVATATAAAAPAMPDTGAAATLDPASLGGLSASLGGPPGTSTAFGHSALAAPASGSQSTIPAAPHHIVSLGMPAPPTPAVAPVAATAAAAAPTAAATPSAPAPAPAPVGPEVSGATVDQLVRLLVGAGSASTPRGPATARAGRRSSAGARSSEAFTSPPGGSLGTLPVALPSHPGHHTAFPGIIGAQLPDTRAAPPPMPAWVVPPTAHQVPLAAALACTEDLGPAIAPGSVGGDASLPARTTAAVAALRCPPTLPLRVLDAAGAAAADALSAVAPPMDIGIATVASASMAAASATAAAAPPMPPAPRTAPATGVETVAAPSSAADDCALMLSTPPPPPPPPAAAAAAAVAVAAGLGPPPISAAPPLQTVSAGASVPATAAATTAASAAKGVAAPAAPLAPAAPAAPVTPVGTTLHIPLLSAARLPVSRPAADGPPPIALAVGGTATAMAWGPRLQSPERPGAPVRLLAVSCQRRGAALIPSGGPTAPRPQSIQLWAIPTQDPVDPADRLGTRARLVALVPFVRGPVLALSWCPDSAIPGRRAGILACACACGTVMAIPLPRLTPDVRDLPGVDPARQPNVTATVTATPPLPGAASAVPDPDPRNLSQHAAALREAVSAGSGQLAASLEAHFAVAYVALHQSATSVAWDGQRGIAAGTSGGAPCPRTRGAFGVFPADGALTGRARVAGEVLSWRTGAATPFPMPSDTPNGCSPAARVNVAEKWSVKHDAPMDTRITALARHPSTPSCFVAGSSRHVAIVDTSRPSLPALEAQAHGTGCAGSWWSGGRAYHAGCDGKVTSFGLERRDVARVTFALAEVSSVAAAAGSSPMRCVLTHGSGCVVELEEGVSKYKGRSRQRAIVRRVCARWSGTLEMPELSVNGNMAWVKRICESLHPRNVKSEVEASLRANASSAAHAGVAPCAVAVESETEFLPGAAYASRCGIVIVDFLDK